MCQRSAVLVRNKCHRIVVPHQHAPALAGRIVEQHFDAFSIRCTWLREDGASYAWHIARGQSFEGRQRRLHNHASVKLRLGLEGLAAHSFTLFRGAASSDAIALCGLHWIVIGHFLGHAQRDSNHLLDVTHTLHLVGVQQRLIACAIDHSSQLPAKIECVADTGVPALTSHHRHHVCRVARQEDLANLELTSHTRMVAVNAATNDIQLAWIGDMRSQQVEDEVIVIDQRRIFVLEQREFPAADTVGQRNAGIATLGVAAEHCMWRSDGVVGNVNHYAARWTSLAFERNIHSHASSRCATFCRDNIACAQLFASGCCGDYASFIFVQIDNFSTETHRCAWETLEAIQQHLIHQWLHKSVTAGPAKLTSCWVDFRQDLSIAIDHVDLLIGDGVRQHLIYQTHRLHRTQCFVVDTHSAWVVDQCFVLLNDKNLNALLTQQVAQHEANRPCSNNENVRIFAHDDFLLLRECDLEFVDVVAEGAIQQNEVDTERNIVNQAISQQCCGVCRFA